MITLLRFTLVALFLLSVSPSFGQLEILPHGQGERAIVSEHFPDRVHEFVWRNWNVITPAKIAAVLGTGESEVTTIAVSMGLPAEPSIPPRMMERGYVSIIRRNWHLLPYEQLLQLLDMTPQRLDVMLREEDFLWVKLGRTKPACTPLRFEPPDESARARAAEIRAVVEQEFGAAIAEPGEPRFDFVRQLGAPLPDYELPATSSADVQFPRIVHSYVAIFGDPLLNPQLDPYPDGYLQRLSEVGINGVWLHALLRDLAPGGPTFPEFGEDHEVRLANLRVMVDRAQKFGVKIYLYINEPRGMPHAFFDAHPELAGARTGELTALCTSMPEVRKWMGDALAYIFREVPGLGGIYSISGSENLTNCVSHGDPSACPRCRDRRDADILAEVVAVQEEGVHRGNPSANVLISDWGWRGHGDAQDIIPHLPKNIFLISVSEWHLPITRGGIESTVGEYSISAVGPGPRSLAHWTVARQNGLKTGTEIQFNNTCEIATIPYLPVMDLVGEHCQNLRTKTHLDAMFIGWTMGGHPSPNFQLAQRLSRTPAQDVETALNEIAAARYGHDGVALARQAWTMMSDAFREYPFHISVVYTCPIQWGPANLLYATRTGYSATMWGLPYDHLDGWRGPYPAAVFADQFDKVAQGWKPGIETLQQAAQHAPPAMRAAATADVRYAKAAAIHFQSVANQARFTNARDTLANQDAELSDSQRGSLRAQMRDAAQAEIALAKDLYALVKEDSRIGFEPSCQYFYLPLDLVEKVVNCRCLLQQLERSDESIRSQEGKEPQNSQ